jgi:methyl-accepting chemotaxis protein
MNIQNMKVSTRLAMAFALVLLTMLTAITLALVQLSNVHTNLEQMVLQNNVKIRLANDMSQTVHIVSRVIRTMVLLTEPAAQQAEKDQLGKAREQYDAAWAVLEKMPATEQGAAIRKNIDQSKTAARAINNSVVELAMANKDAEATELLLKTAAPEIEKWQGHLQEIVKLQETSTASEFEEAQSNYQTARLTLLIASACCIGLSVFSAWFVTRSITRQLGAEPGDAVRLAQGVAAGDLAMRIDLKAGDTLSMMAQLQNMQQSLVAVVERVREGSESVSTASAEIAQGNQDLSSRTESQASALEQTAASMEELSATVKQNADSARQANQLALNASLVAGKGGEVVSQVVDTMKEINDSSRKIADIISVIDGIAFQTNILALNAAVEAARAGEQGRGFAVVATEVRSLAGRSADAAKEIKSLITASVERVDAGTALVDEAGMTMAEVVTAVKRVTDLMGEISAASNEQSAGVSQVGEAVMQMDQVTQQNAALVEEMAAAASSLRSQADDLVQTVAVFNTGVQRAPKVSVKAIPVRVTSSAAFKGTERREPAVKNLATSTPTGARSTVPMKKLAVTTAGNEDWESF